MPLTDPHSWEVLVFGDETAWIDFLGSHELWHRSFDTVVRALGGAPYANLPLGDGGGWEWHEAHQLAHAGEASALSIAGPPDFRSYDLGDRDQFASWNFLHAAEHIRLRQSAGV